MEFLVLMTVAGGVIGYTTALLTYGRHNTAPRVAPLSILLGVVSVPVTVFVVIQSTLTSDFIFVLPIVGAVAAQIPAWWLARRVPHCPNCGMRQSKQHTFCLRCGHEMTPAPIPAPNAKPQRWLIPVLGSWRATILAGLTLFAIGFVSALLFYVPPTPVYQYTTPNQPVIARLPTTTPIPFTEIVVAVQELPRGLLIPEEGAVQLRPWPAGPSVPIDAIWNINEVIGKIALTDIPRESPVLSTMIGGSLYDLHPVNVSDNPWATLPLGRLGAGSLVRGILSTETPTEEWIFYARAGETTTFRLSSEDIRQTLSSPVLMIWAEDTEEWLDGQRVQHGASSSLTVTFPRDAVYIVVVGRDRLVMGRGSGVYSLRVFSGAVEAPLADYIPTPTIPAFTYRGYPY